MQLGGDDRHFVFLRRSGSIQFLDFLTPLHVFVSLNFTGEETRSMAEAVNSPPDEFVAAAVEELFTRICIPVMEHRFKSLTDY
jgi:hypothetical protein